MKLRKTVYMGIITMYDFQRYSRTGLRDIIRLA